MLFCVCALWLRPLFAKGGELYYSLVPEHDYGHEYRGDSQPDEQRPPPREHGVAEGADEVARHYPEEHRPLEPALGKFGLGGSASREAGYSRHVEHYEGDERGPGYACVLYHNYGFLHTVFGALEAGHEHGGEHGEGGYYVLLCDQARDGRNGEYPAVFIELRAEAERREYWLNELADRGENGRLHAVCADERPVPGE